MYSMSKQSLLREVKKLAHPSVLTMPTTEGPVNNLDAKSASCRLCSGRQVPAMRVKVI